MYGLPPEAVVVVEDTVVLVEDETVEEGIVVAEAVVEGGIVEDSIAVVEAVVKLVEVVDGVEPMPCPPYIIHSSN